jgi:polar amino acid transport system substrate-binding protein
VFLFNKKETLIVGIETPFPPFYFYEDGKLVGFDIDLSSKIAEKLGYDIQYKNLEFKKLEEFIGDTNNNFVDIVMSIRVTDDRKSRIMFTNSYLNNGDVVVISINNKNIKNIKDIQGKKVFVSKGTHSAKIAENIDGATVVPFSSSEEAILYLITDDENVAIMNEAVAKNYIKNNYDTVEIAFPISKGEIAIGVSKNKVDLIEKINKVIKVMEQDGSYVEIYNKWFGEM